jgi:hypothetical protein
VFPSEHGREHGDIGGSRGVEGAVTVT